MAGFEVLNPTSFVRSQNREGRLARRLSGLNDKVIGLVDDGLVGTEIYMRGVEQRLQAEFPGLTTHFWAKPILSRPSPSALIAEAAERCDAVIVGSAG